MWSLHVLLLLATTFDHASCGSACLSNELKCEDRWMKGIDGENGSLCIPTWHLYIKPYRKKYNNTEVELGNKVKKCKVMDKLTGHALTCELPEDYECETCLINEEFLDDRCFRCLRSTDVVISVRRLCDDDIDCPDLSDECLCGASHAKDICEQIRFGDQEDSVSGDEGDDDVEVPLLCASNNGSLITITEDEICDGRSHCYDDFDEKFCDVENETKDYECWYEKNETKKYPRPCDGISKCNRDETEESERENSTRACALEIIEKIHLSCPDVWTERTRMCDGTPDCEDGIDELLCTNRTHQYCNTTKGNNFIPVWKKCDLIPDCIDESDEKNCSNNFRCEKNEQPKYIKQNQVCDGVLDCAYAEDECQDGCLKSSFSDTRSMIKYTSVLVLLFFIGILAIAGNLLAIYKTTQRFPSPKQLRARESRNKNFEQREKINQALLFNLGISDLLVGIYLVSICAVSVRVEGHYCEMDYCWRSTDACSALGVLLVIGSEQAVLIMVLISVSRWHAVAKTFHDAKLMKLTVAIGLAWIVSVVIATVPLIPSLEDEFITVIRYRNNTIFSKIERYEVKMLTQWLIPVAKNFSESVHGRIGSWRALNYLLKKLDPNTIVDKKYGFYSSHTVCIPDLFPDREKDNFWWYSILVLVLNFASFLLILFFNIAIYKAANKPNAEADSDVRTKQAIKMQRKLTAIVVTDFVCWVPVCIMAFLRQLEVPIPDDWRLVVGLLLLPINSCVNPIIYSNIPEMICSGIVKLRSRSCNSTSGLCARFTRGSSHENDAEESKGEELAEVERRAGSALEVTVNAEDLCGSENDVEVRREEVVADVHVSVPLEVSTCVIGPRSRNGSDREGSQNAEGRDHGEDDGIELETINQQGDFDTSNSLVIEETV